MHSQVADWSLQEAEGWRQFDSGDMRAAIDAWADVLHNLSPTPQNSRFAATLLSNIAMAHERLKEFRDAIIALDKALCRHFESPPPTTEADTTFRAQSLYRMGNCFRAQDEYGSAADCFSQSVQIAALAADLELTIKGLIAWSAALERLGDLLRAVNVMNRARNLARGLPDGSPLRAKAEESVHVLLLAASELYD
jgi:tetratricopeptide (TPR) repeat protein